MSTETQQNQPILDAIEIKNCWRELRKNPDKTDVYIGGVISPKDYLRAEEYHTHYSVDVGWQEFKEWVLLMLLAEAGEL